MVLGGDFNVSTQFEPPWDERTRGLFGELEKLGFVNVLATAGRIVGGLDGCSCSDDPCTQFETWRAKKGRGKKPRQDDYVFVSEDLETGVSAVRVGPIDHQLSDHAPLVLDLALAD
jgi:endonuclease/exonuclease/phosphatase family metal-dependent hydrolase